MSLSRSCVVFCIGLSAYLTFTLCAEEQSQTQSPAQFQSQSESQIQSQAQSQIQSRAQIQSQIESAKTLGNENATKLESATFKTLNGCEKSFYPVTPYKQFETESRTKCATACLSDPDCTSINVAARDPSKPEGPEVHCVLFDKAAAGSCADVYVDAETPWTYMRLTNYQGKGRTKDTGEVSPESTSQCSEWQRLYWIENKQEFGDKKSFLKTLSGGAMITILVLTPTDRKLHKLTPIDYLVVKQNTDNADGDNGDIVYFQFAPRFYVEYVSSAYTTFKDYIGIGTDGKLSVRRFSMAEDLKSEASGASKAYFYTKEINNKPDGTPSYVVTPDDVLNSDTPNTDDLVAEVHKGSEFLVHLQYGSETLTMHDKWSRLNSINNAVEVGQFQGVLFERAEPTLVGNPLRRYMRVTSTDGSVTESSEGTIGTLETTQTYHYTQSWFVDSCWEVAAIFDSDGNEDAVYDSTNLYNRLKQGVRARVQFVEGDFVKTKSVLRSDCANTGCSGYFEIMPITDNTGRTELDAIASETSGSHVSMQDVTNPTSTYTVKSKVTWFVDSVPYEEVFVWNQDAKKLELDNLHKIADSGVNVHMVIEQGQRFTSLEILDVVRDPSAGEQFEFHTVAVAKKGSSLTGCALLPMTRTAFILHTSKDNTVSLIAHGWTIDRNILCAVDESVQYTKVTVFASKH